jgi:hypothetical protein
VAADVPEDPGEQFWTHYNVSLEAKLREKQLQRDWSPFWKAAGALVAATLVIVAVRVGTIEPTKSITEDREVAVALIEELYRIYDSAGLIEEDGLQTSYSADALNKLAAGLPDYEDAFTTWFEVEDEPNHLMM